MPDVKLVVSKVVRPTTAYVCSLLFGAEIVSDPINKNTPGDITGFDADSQTLLIEEGRRQLADQSDRFRHLCDRALALLTVALAVLGLMATSYTHVAKPSGIRGGFTLGLWALGASLAVIGTAATAAVAVVRAQFSSIDATIVSNLESPVRHRLAAEYAKAVIVGETTLAERVTVFRQAVRCICWSAMLLGAAYVLAVL